MSLPGTMTREQAVALLALTPEYIPAPCPWCRATTTEEASTRCRPMCMPCGDYACGTPDEAPDDGGLIHQRNPDYDGLAGYLREWLAFDEGLTDTPPTWREDETE